MTTTMERARLTTQPSLESALAGLPLELAEMARYALGGKGIRPALVMLSAEACGGGPREAVPGAVAIELAHTFSLVHDDIMDGDESRRGRPTVWKAFGLGSAVLTGDALLALAYETLAVAEGCATAVFARAVTSLMRGQARDLAFEARPWVGDNAVSVNEYLQMSGDKTGALMQCAASLGAALCGASPEVVKELGIAGFHMGLAFQAVDDLLGIWGDPAVTGKPVSTDLVRGKKTLPILAAVHSSTPAGDRLVCLLKRGLSDAGDLKEAAQLVLEAGGRQATEREAETQVGRAFEALSRAEIHSSARAELMELAQFLVSRQA